MTALRLVESPAVDHREWSAAEAARAAGISYRQLDYWCRSGVIVPAHAEGREGEAVRWRATPGSGRRRRFDSHQVALLAACGQLARLCADTAALAALVDACGAVALPVAVAIDAAGEVHLDRLPAGACWLVHVEPLADALTHRIGGRS